MVRVVEIDIWNNITYYEDVYIANIWYKQEFIEDDIVYYEDFRGNYWTKEFGPFPYHMLELVDEYVGRLVAGPIREGYGFTKRQPIISIIPMYNELNKLIVVHLSDSGMPFPFNKKKP